MNRDDLIALYDFTGRTFAVTGGGGALGSDVVVALAGCGANVMFLDRNLAGLASVKERVGARASQVDGVQADVMNRWSRPVKG